MADHSVLRSEGAGRQGSADRFTDMTDVAPSSRHTVTITDMARVPLRRWPAVFVSVLITVCAVLAYLWVVPATYSATAVVVVRPIVNDPFTYPAPGADRTVNMNAENGLANSSAVTTAIADELRIPVAQVRSSMAIELPVGGNVLRFNFSADKPDLAIRGANASANAFLRARQKLYEDQRAGLVASYDKQIQAVAERRAAAQAALPANLPGGGGRPASIEGLVDQVRALSNELSSLSERRAQIASIDVTPGSVTRAAEAPARSSHDGALLYLGGAVLGGILIGAIVAFGLESADRRVRSEDEAAELTGLPLLGVVRRGPRSVAGADLRYVGLAIADRLERDQRPIVLISTRGGEGRTRLVASLAVTLAAQGHDVSIGGASGTVEELRNYVLVDRRALAATSPGQRADIAAAELATRERPTPEEFKRGLPAAWLAANVNMDDTIRLPGMRGGNSTEASAGGETNHGGSSRRVSVIGAEADVDDTTEEATDDVATSGPAVVTDGRAVEPIQVGTGTVRFGVSDAATEAGVVLLDAPGAETDERGVHAARNGTAILVIARDQTRVADLRRLVTRLRSARARTVGFVLTRSGRG